jgi:hypothetical protein
LAFWRGGIKPLQSTSLLFTISDRISLKQTRVPGVSKVVKKGHLSTEAAQMPTSTATAHGLTKQVQHWTAFPPLTSTTDWGQPGAGHLTSLCLSFSHCKITMLLLPWAFFFFFLGGTELRTSNCKADALPLEPHHHSILLWLF